MSRESNQSNDSSDLSLLLNGPLYHFYLWARLAKKPLLLYKRRIIIICLFAWLPLFILSIFNGVAFGGVNLPFISDIEVHARFLISLALLLYGEVLANERLQIIVRHFLQSNLLSAQDRKKFRSMIASAMRLTHSIIAEIFLIIFVISAGHAISSNYLPINISTWYAYKENGIGRLTLSGYWYVFISLPLFQFILIRWYYRLGIWYRFVWQISRLQLRLNSLHPDRAGGLGFLTNSIYAFEPLLIAHSVLLAGIIINRMWYAGVSLSQFQFDILGLIIFLIILPLAPLMFFVFALSETKRYGTIEYDKVADRYVDDFRKKWIDAEPKDSETMLGNPDFQSLADLGNSYEVSNKMRITPFNQGNIILIMLSTALPFFPLFLLIMPFEKIIRQAINIVF